MFLVNGMFACVFLFFSPMTTYLGSVFLVDDTKKVYEKVSRDSIDGLRVYMLDSLKREFEGVAGRQDSIYEDMIDKNGKALAADLKSAKNRRYRFNILVDSGRVELNEKRFEARSDVEIKKNEKDAKEAAMAADRNKSMLDLEGEYRAAKFQVGLWYEKEEAKLAKIDEEKGKLVEVFNSGYSWVLTGIGLGAVFVIVLITMVREVYKRGSDIKDVEVVYEVEGSRFVKATTLLRKTIFYNLDKILNTWENWLPDPNTPIDFSWIKGIKLIPGRGNVGIVNEVEEIKKNGLGFQLENKLEKGEIGSDFLVGKEPENELPTGFHLNSDKVEEKELEGEVVHELKVVVRERNGVKMPMFIHTNGKEYTDEGCEKNRTGWVSKLGSNEKALEVLLKDVKKKVGKDVEKWNKKIDRKKNTIANNREQVKYWSDARDEVVGQKIKLELI